MNVLVGDVICVMSKCEYIHIFEAFNKKKDIEYLSGFLKLL